MSHSSFFPIFCFTRCGPFLNHSCHTFHYFLYIPHPIWPIPEPQMSHSSFPSIFCFTRCGPFLNHRCHTLLSFLYVFPLSTRERLLSFFPGTFPEQTQGVCVFVWVGRYASEEDETLAMALAHAYTQNEEPALQVGSHRTATTTHTTSTTAITTPQSPHRNHHTVITTP